MRAFQCFALATSSLIPMAAPPLLGAQLEASPKDSEAQYIFLLEDDFRGWVCVDFGVAGAKRLPREGNARVIRPRQGRVLPTSDKASGVF